MSTVAGFVVAKLSQDQLDGNRCAVCKASWYIQAVSGPGFSRTKVATTLEPEGVEVFMCAAHGATPSENKVWTMGGVYTR